MIEEDVKVLTVVDLYEKEQSQGETGKDSGGKFHHVRDLIFILLYVIFELSICGSVFSFDICAV